MKITASGFGKVLHVLALNFLPVSGGTICVGFAVAGCSGQPDVATGDASVGGRTSAGGSPGLGGNTATGGASGVACPSAAPQQGATCNSAGQICSYQNCATTGVSVATCQGHWSVSTTPCSGTVTCASAPGQRTCGQGQICLVRAGGTIDVQCVDNTCGSAPVDCACLGSCAGVCTLQTNTTGLTMYCNACPQGGCA